MKIYDHSCLSNLKTYKGKAKHDECDPHGGNRIFDPVKEEIFLNILQYFQSTDEVQM